MINRKITLAALLFAAVFSVCKGPAVKDPVVTVGRVTIGAEGFDAFQRAMNVYPAPMPRYFPGQTREAVTFMAECEAIWQTTRRSSGVDKKIKSSLDWEWKKMYFMSTPFFENLGLLGFTDAELQEYYNGNPDVFRSTVKTAEGADSTVMPDFESSKRQAADMLFAQTYKPDADFMKRIESENANRDTPLDSAEIRNYWLYHVRSNPADFFMRRMILEETGRAYSDSVEQIFGEGKPIKPEDLEVIRSWVAEERRESMREKELVEWLYKWKRFSELAVKKGQTNTQAYKDMFYWAERMEYALKYIEEKVVSGFDGKAETAADTALARLTIYDRMGRADDFGDLRLGEELANIANTRLSARIDSAVYDIRKRAKITFLQNDRKDTRSSNPAALIASADSLRDAVADSESADDMKLMEEAQDIYRALTNEFAFTPEGRRAMGELAKIQIDRFNSGTRNERHLLTSAISAYRRAQAFDTDSESLCNSYFMTGFTYDEYLNNYALAEANYKWILKFAPECSLASDAEFMLQHLDEPMTSIEEIQGQSARQGRSVEFDEEGGAEDEVL